MRISGWVTTLAWALALSAPATAQWVDFADESATRLNGPDPSVLRNDVAEKDYAWGDVDNDGDIDLVVVRKEPFTTPGKRTNVLLLNVNGVLTDVTAQFAAESDVPGDQGFLTPTNDRDVQLVDVNGDGFLDIVTATTLSDADPKAIGHPRIYINKGQNGAGAWLGFRHEDGRIPAMDSYTGVSSFNPRFCSVASGDLTDDGFPELWFGDYDSSGAGGFSQPSGADFNDRLLVNDGNGFFSDQTYRLSGTVDGVNQPFEVSAFGAAAAITDLNGDGTNDVVKQTSLSQPLYVGVSYNGPDGAGFFDNHDVIITGAPYFISVGDLNNDGMQDIVITDDGQDVYLLNTGTPFQGHASFLPLAFQYSGNVSDDGIGGNNLIVDLNNDGHNDVLIADVDVDIQGCNRRMHIYRNLGGSPGNQVTLVEQITGDNNCQSGNGTCRVAGIVSENLKGVHDVAVFDLDGDGWNDMVVGRCSGTEVYINQPPEPGLVFSYPQGIPSFVPPGQPFVFQVKVDGFDGAVPQPGTGKMYLSLAGGPFGELPLTALGGDLYEATLPASMSCAAQYRFYFTAEERLSGALFFDPDDAPVGAHSAIPAFGTELLLEDDLEGDVSAWTVINDPSLGGGGWQAALPIGTLTGGGEQAAPSEDAEAAMEQVTAFVTGNGLPGGAAADSDVDLGPTDLISPPIDLSGTDGVLTYSRWFFSDGGSDALTVEISGDGASWTLVETVAGLNNFWQVNSFRVGDYITPSATVQLRFRTADTPNNSIVEAGIDLLKAARYVCAPCANDPDCDDQAWCNGAETCTNGFCFAGTESCLGEICDEANDVCVECLVDADCDDADYCNGVETCSANVCTPGSSPCPMNQVCDELFDSCVDCLVDTDCYDGLFCNGLETCDGGTCQAAAPSCPGQPCDEVNDSCVGTAALQPRMGQPLPGLFPAELDRFNAGRVAFEKVFTVQTGLGPTFNQSACASCHNTPVGGAGSVTVTRFGFNDDKGGGFDPLASLGGSLLQEDAFAAQCNETIPASANVTAQRVTPALLGFGLAEAIADGAIEANALVPPSGVSGVVHYVEPLEAPGTTRVGRFGWKSQIATVLSFSGDAATAEMGFTNRLVPNEHPPNGNLTLLAQCDMLADPEDQPDTEGFDFIDRVTDFQRFLAAPPQTPRSGMTGEISFLTLGCAKCHKILFATPDDPQLEVALRNKSFKPYSDFLLHDMGQNADFIGQGAAEPREMRTAPLWGLRARNAIWHDGRFAAGTFESRVIAAIAAHDSLGSEAAATAQAFQAGTQVSQDRVVSFLGSLGRAEFDHDGDGDVDDLDFNEFLACRAGLSGPVTPNQPCGISDIDQDGDVDDDDFVLFLVALDNPVGGRVADLRVDAAAGGELALSWGASCASDPDFAVYEGFLGVFDSHQPLLCSTAGATAATVTPGSGDRYYLIVPTTGISEGSYGSDGSGVERPAAALGFACHAQSLGQCN